MTYGIIAALDAELNPLLKELELEEKKEACGTVFYTGKLAGNRVVLCKCGVATINAALCAGIIAREFGADAIINTGIAGALGKGVQMLDVVISSEACYHDRDDEILVKYYPFATSFPADPALVERAKRAAEGMSAHGRTVNVHVGRIASGDWYVRDSATKRAIVEKCHPLCVEMEGAAIANAAFVNNCPFVVIRAMSDCAEENANEQYDALIDDAGALSASIVLKMLREDAE